MTATPIVAGHIANLLSYDKVPIGDTSPGNLVRSMRDYLKEDESAGWVRTDPIRVLWNGVTEDENPRFKRCTSLSTNKYVARETLRRAIEDDFCNLALTTPVSRRYHEGTLEHVVISLAHDTPTPDPSVLTRDACVRYLLGDVTDACYFPDDNPANYKAGGAATLGGVTYAIEPQTQRQPAGVEGGSGCDSTYGFLHNSYVVWGRGWAGDDFGQNFQDEMAGHACAPRAGTWRFEYGLGSDGREWTARFRTDAYKKACVSWSAKHAGAPDDFTCHGSG